MDNKLDSFKQYVKKNPGFITSVRNKSTTWQELYDLYSLYGEDDNAFFKYLNNTTSNTTKNSTWEALLDAVKGIDAASLQKGLDSVQKGIGVFKDMFVKDATPSVKRPYQGRPFNRYYDD